MIIDVMYNSPLTAWSQSGGQVWSQEAVQGVGEMKAAFPIGQHTLDTILVSVWTLGPPSDGVGACQPLWM